MESLCIKYNQEKLELIDQTLLPHTEKWLHIKTIDEMIEAIKQLRVRGAPAIGVAASLALAQFAKKNSNLSDITKVAKRLYEARPTAVNLMLAMDRLILKNEKTTAEEIIIGAEKIFFEDIELCEKMANYGSTLIDDGDTLLTHCNTGGLATVGIGTALGVIKRAKEQGKKTHLYVDETRPLLQGGRLTAYECEKLNIPYTLICDNMAAMLMAQGKIKKIFLGSDRIAANGDFANKIGTYSLAVIAKYHNVKFYPVAPYTTIDPNCPNGAAIPIEERKPEEVRREWAPKNAPVFNPAFDVTPVELVTALVTDHGIFSSKELKQGKHLKR